MLILVLLLTVLCCALRGHRCQYVMVVCGEESATGSGVGEFVLHQLMKMMTAQLVCMLHVSAHLPVFSEIQGSRHYSTKKIRSAHRDSFANPFAVLLNVLLEFLLRKVCRKPAVYI